MSYRNILIITGGLNPQVVTETIWALAKRTPPFWPDKVVLVLTAGVRRRYDEELARAGGKLDELCTELGRPTLWDKVDIRDRMEGQGRIDDIRSDKDAIAFGDLVAEIVRRERRTRPIESTCRWPAGARP